jgi:hypothetical protein
MRSGILPHDTYKADLSSASGCVGTLNYQFVLVFIAVLIIPTRGNDQNGNIVIFSPREDVKHPKDQDLIVKFEVKSESQPCSVVALLNGKLERVVNNCKLSFAIDADELIFGLNELELLLQAHSSVDDGERDEPSASLTFRVEPREPWSAPEPACHGAASADTCDRCLHAVNGTCILHRDTSSHPIPRIFHWVWVGGGGPIPARFEPYMASWRSLHPDWQFVVW